MMKVNRLFRWLFAGRKKIQWDEHSIYNHLINKYALTITGDTFYIEGNSISQFLIGENESKEYINAIFENVNKGLSEHIEIIQWPVKSRIAEIDELITQVAHQLDESESSGYLYDINEKLNYSKGFEKEMESIIFPEKELQKMINKSLKKYESIVDEAVEIDNSALGLLNRANEQNILSKEMKMMMRTFQELMDGLSSTRHSFLHPPKLRFILFFYSMCIVLLFAEIGISMTVLQDIMDAEITHSEILTDLLPVLYAVGIAASSAILMKIIIEKYLFKGRSKVKTFKMMMLVAFCVLTTLFLGATRDFYSMQTVSWMIIIKAVMKSLVISAFSLAIALANAFLFREASYLHHMRFRLNGGYNIRRLNRQKRRYTAKWERVRRYAEAEKKMLELNLVQLEKIKLHVQGMFGNLKMISLASYNRGHREMVAAVIKSRDDLALAIGSKIRAKMNK